MKKFIFLLFLFPLIAFGQAQLELPYSVKVLNPKPLDAYYYNTSFAPYTSTAQVISQVKPLVRYKGQTFNVNGVDYCFCQDTTAAHLQVKVFDLFKSTNLNQNGHNFAINGVAGNMFTKWNYAKGSLIITDDTTSMYEGNTNTTNIMYGNTDSLSGSIGYSLIHGSFNHIDGTPVGAFANFVSGTNNFLSNSSATTVTGNNNYHVGSSYFSSIGNLMGGWNSRMYDCVGCFAMGSVEHSFLTPLFYKPTTVGQVGTELHSAFNFSRNSNAQTYGNGVHSSYASILGGSDHNIAVGANGSGIFGGRQIHLVSGDSNTVAFPKVKMFQGLNATATNDNTLASIIGVDGSGNVKTRDASSLGHSPSGTGGTFQFNDGSGNFAATETATGATYNGRLTYDNVNGFTNDTKNTGTNSTSYYTLAYPGGVHYRNGISPVIDGTTLSPTGIVKDNGISPFNVTAGGGSELALNTTDASNANAGGVAISAGNVISGNGNGGTVVITSGNGSGTGSDGSVQLISRNTVWLDGNLVDIDATSGLQLSGNAGLAGQVIKSQGPGLPPVWAGLASLFTFSNYTPTLTAVTNVNTVTAPANFKFRYDGNVVEIFGTISVFPTTSGSWGNVVFNISSPPGYTTTFSNDYDVTGIVSGVYTGSATTPISGIVEAIPSSTNLKCTFTSTNAANAYTLKVHIIYSH